MLLLIRGGHIWYQAISKCFRIRAPTWRDVAMARSGQTASPGPGVFRHNLKGHIPFHLGKDGRPRPIIVVGIRLVHSYPSEVEFEFHKFVPVTLCV